MQGTPSTAEARLGTSTTDPISPGSAAAEQKQQHELHLSPSSPRANNVGGSAALRAASWGASEVALPERSPAAACDDVRPQTSTAFKDSQPRPVARVVALPPLLSPPPPSCSVLISTTLLWRGTGVQQNFCPLTRNIVSPSSLHLRLNISRLQLQTPAELLSHCCPIPHRTLSV